MHPLDSLAGITLAQQHHDLAAALAEATRRHASTDVRPSRPSLVVRIRALATGRSVTARPSARPASRTSSGGRTSAHSGGRS
jgi:hypothetical protein